MDTIKFFKGEKRLVDLKVIPTDPNEIAVIKSAKYELIDSETEKVIEHGQCESDTDNLTVLLRCEKSGSYVLKFKIEVGRETYIDKVKVRVM